MAASNVPQLLQEAADFVQMFEYQQAVDKFHEAYQLEPENTEVLDNLAEVLLELGEVEDAHNILLRSIELKPNEGVSKYMNLGQITSGPEAVDAFRKGIELLKKELGSRAKKGTDKVHGLLKQLASAYVSISEIYMTDLCDEEDAEQVCGECLDEALKVDNTNWETYQAIASYRISQQNNEDALEQMKKSYNLWKDLEAEDIDRPSYEARVTAAKLFIELEAYYEAGEILETVLLDNDEDAETWYLAAFCYSTTDVRSCPEYLENAKNLLTRQGITDPGIHKQVDDLMVKVAAELETLPPEDDNGQVDDENSDRETMEED